MFRQYCMLMVYLDPVAGQVQEGLLQLQPLKFKWIKLIENDAFRFRQWYGLPGSFRRSRAAEACAAATT